MAHVGLDIVRLYHEHLARKKIKGLMKSAGANGEDSVTEQGEMEWRAKWRKEMVVNLAYAPLTVHWGLERGLITDFWVGVLGSVASVAGLRELWTGTAGVSST